MPEIVGTSAAAQTATIHHALYDQTGPYVGLTIADIKKKFSAKWSIPADATGYKGKTALADDYRIQANDEITLSRRQGEKGRG